MKLVVLVLLGLICLSYGKRFPRTHSEFWATPNEQFIVGYYLDWGHGPFDPIVATAGMSRVNDLDLLLFSFITLTYDVNIVWGGKGYANGDLVEGYFADNNCTIYNGQQFGGSFCKTWQPTGFCSASDVECPINKPQGGWCASERLNPIMAQSAQKQQPLGISVGGWSDTIDTPFTTAAAQTLANNIVAFVNGINNSCGGTVIISAIDFDFEHLSDPQANGTKDTRIAAYATMVASIRQQLPDMVLSYCTRFNAFSNYSQNGQPFASNQEGVAVAQAFTNLGLNIADVFTYVNIMAYDTPPSVISPQGWTIAAYEAILKSFDNRYGGLFSPSQLVMGLETGQQAAGGIYEGYERSLCLINYIYQNQYKGVMIWAPNQFTYRYMDQDNQVACNFSGTSPYNETAWNIGWPSGADPLNPNCMFYPINQTSPQFNGPMADCIENIGPFIANQAQQIFDGTLQVPSSYCQAPSWNPCNWCPPNSVREGSNCVCNTGYIMVNNTCVQCQSPQVIVNGQCQCPVPGQTLVNGQCVCPSNQVVVNNQCSSCPSGQVVQNGKCVCPTQGQVLVNGQCQCPSGQTVVNNQCTACQPPEVIVNGVCQCPASGQTLVNGQCQCPSGQTVVNNQCTSCQPPEVIVNGVCQCPASGQTLVNGQCQCPSGQTVVNNQCTACQPPQVIVNGVCQCPASGQTLVNGQCVCPTNEVIVNNACTACPSGQVVQNGQCVCQISGQTLVNGTCQCPPNETVVNGQCAALVCPANSFRPTNGNCPQAQLLTDGCCCDTGYYAQGNVCLVLNPTCNCTQWMLTPAGIQYGIPLSWCYIDCYSPNAYPIGLNIACSRYTYDCSSTNTECTLSNQLNTAHQFCGCTQQQITNSTDPQNCIPHNNTMFIKQK